MTDELCEKCVAYVEGGSPCQEHQPYEGDRWRSLYGISASDMAQDRLGCELFAGGGTPVGGLK